MARGTSGERFDLAAVGAGLVALATALAAVRRGLRAVVMDRDATASGTSVRNFAFGLEPPRVLQRWVGTYAYARDRSVFVDAPAPEARVAIVTCGAGA